MAVTDYSTTAGNNSTISGVNIAEGCSPAGINNAIRQMMADVRAFYDATPLIAGTPTVSGNWTVSGAWKINGNMTFKDNVKAIFGTGSDLRIYHDGSNSFIEDAGTGSLSLKGSIVQITGTSDEVLVRGTAGGAAELRQNGSTKLTTSTTGVTVTGAVSADTAAGNWFLDEDDMASNSATKLASQQSIKAYVDAAGIGVGQTWQDVGGSRLAGTSYRNTTGKPIMVAIRGNTNSTHYLQVSTNNATWVSVGSTIAASANMTAIIPDDHYYRLQSGATFNGWSELR
jgi:hypothetical protein